MAKAVLGAAEIAGGVALMATGVGGPLGAMLLSSGITTEAGAIAQALGSKAGLATTTRSPASYRQIIRGEQRVPGVIVYSSTTGSSKRQYNLVIVLATHPCEAIVNLYLDGRQVFWSTSSSYNQTVNGVNFGGNADGNDHIGPNGVHYNFGGKVFCAGFYGKQTSDPTVVNGTWVGPTTIDDTTASYPGFCSALQANDGTWSPTAQGTPYLAGCTYVYLKLEADSGTFPQFPEIRFTVRGKNDIFDPRTSTTGYTTNWALHVADAITDVKWGLGDNTVNQNQLIAAANVCDESVTCAAGTESRYTLHWHYDTSISPGDAIERMMSAAAGRLSRIGGEWFIWPAYWQGPSFTFDADSLIDTVQWTPKRSLDSLFNRVTGTYIAANYPYSVAGDLYDSNGYFYGQTQNNFPYAFQPTNYPMYACDQLHGYGTGVDVYLTEDGGIYLPKEIDQPCVLSISQAQRVAKIMLLRNRQQGTGILPMNLGAYQMQPTDVLQMNFSRLSWSNKVLEVVGTTLRYVKPNGSDTAGWMVEVAVQETDSSVYEWSTTEELSPYDVPVMGGGVESYTVAAPTNVTITDDAATAQVLPDGTTLARALVQWTPPADTYVQNGGSIEVKYQLQASTQSGIPASLNPTQSGSVWVSDWIAAGTLDGTATFVYIPGITSQQDINVALRSVRSNGATSGWVEASLTHSAVQLAIVNLVPDSSVQLGNVYWSSLTGTWSVQATSVTGVNGYFLQGAVTTSNAAVLGSAIPVTPGEEYTLSCYMDNTDGTGANIECVLQPTTTPAGVSAPVLTLQMAAGSEGRVSGTVTIPAGVNSVQVAFLANGVSVAAGSSVAFSAPQLQSGNMATPYVPNALDMASFAVQSASLQANNVNPTLLWAFATTTQTATTSPSANAPSFDTQIYSTPIQATVNGVNCIIFQGWDWYLYVIDASTGEMLWRYAFGGPNYGRCQAADVNGDGNTEIFGASHDGYIYCLDHNGNKLWDLGCAYNRSDATGTASSGTSYSLVDSTKNWPKNIFLNGYKSGQGATIQITGGTGNGQTNQISGVDNPGTVWVQNAWTTVPDSTSTYKITPYQSWMTEFMHAGTLSQESGTWYLYVTCFDATVIKVNAATGALVWEYAMGYGTEPFPLIVDIDGDGNLECCVNSADGYVYAFNAADGTVKWKTQTDPINGDGNDAELTAYDINGDNILELLVGTEADYVCVLKGTDGTMLSRGPNVNGWVDCAPCPFPSGTTGYYNFVDGAANGGIVYCYSPSSTVLWRTDVGYDVRACPQYQPVFNDGKSYIVIADMGGYLSVLDPTTGNIIGSAAFPGSIEGTPLIADVNGDGLLEIIVTCFNGYVYCVRLAREPNQGQLPGAPGTGGGSGGGSSSGYSPTPNGYTALSDGTVVEWGTSGVIAGSQAVTLPATLPNGTQATLASTYGSTDRITYIPTAGTTSFVVANNGSGVQATWMAFGSASGTATLSDGTVIQWGTTATISGSLNVTFGTAYPTGATPTVIVCTDGGADRISYVETTNNTGFTVANNGSGCGVFWIAFPTASGSSTLSNGILIKWGGGISPNSGIVNVSFSPSFPKNCWSVVASTVGPSSYDRITYLTTFSSSGFSVANNGSGATANWMALGN